MNYWSDGIFALDRSSQGVILSLTQDPLLGELRSDGITELGEESAQSDQSVAIDKIISPVSLHLIKLSVFPPLLIAQTLNPTIPIFALPDKPYTF
jgi:hypothetical protein